MTVAAIYCRVSTDDQEKEGADQEKIQKILEKARQADKDATAFYLGRMSIIKKVQSERQRDR